MSIDIDEEAQENWENKVVLHHECDCCGAAFAVDYSGVFCHTWLMYLCDKCKNNIGCSTQGDSACPQLCEENRSKK
jgi:hypothetical protein